MSKPIRLFHGISGWRCTNAGDAFSAPLIRALTGRHVQVMAEPENADLFAAGSILHQMPPEWRGVVWGSGFIREEDRLPSKQARIVATRGPLTARRCGMSPLAMETAVYGDPGLLVSRVWPAATEKRYRLGVIPHYIDHDDGRVSNFVRRWDDVTTIDICGRVADVLRAITECDAIVSSSLHGLIFADSYGIPNGWIRLSDKVVGSGFKFRDTAAAMGEPDPMPLDFDGNETVETMLGRVEDAWEPSDYDGKALEAALLEAVAMVDEEGAE